MSLDLWVDDQVLAKEEAKELKKLRRKGYVVSLKSNPYGYRIVRAPKGKHDNVLRAMQAQFGEDLIEVLDRL